MSFLATADGISTPPGKATEATALGEAVRHGVMSALDVLRRPGLLIDGQRRVVCMNAAAQRMVGDGVLISHRQLRASARAADPALQALLRRAACAGSDGRPLGAAPVALPRDAGRPLIVHAAPLAASSSGFQDAAALVTFHRLESASEAAVALLAQALGLTGAEQRLARELASGCGVVRAAEAMGVSPSTARTHLKGIFAKTETHSQSELAALLSHAGYGLC